MQLTKRHKGLIEHIKYQTDLDVSAACEGCKRHIVTLHYNKLDNKLNPNEVRRKLELLAFQYKKFTVTDGGAHALNLCLSK